MALGRAHTTAKAQLSPSTQSSLIQCQNFFSKFLKNLSNQLTNTQMHIGKDIISLAVVTI